MVNVDILLATYNGERYLEEQLNSILSQTYQNYRVLIRDDGSNDKTLTIIDAYISKYPGKFELVADGLPHRGATLSFAYLIEKSTSEYIMLCDQDDVWFDDKIEISLSHMVTLKENHPGLPLLVFSDLVEVDQELKVLNTSFMKSQRLFPEIIDDPIKVLSLNVVAGCTTMFNQLAKSVILPIVSSKIVHDQWIAANISKYGHVSFISKPTIMYRQHTSNAVGANKIGISYFISKLAMPKKQLGIYRDLLKNLSFGVSPVKFFYYKIYFTIRRSFFR